MKLFIIFFYILYIQNIATPTSNGTEGFVAAGENNNAKADAELDAITVSKEEVQSTVSEEKVQSTVSEEKVQSTENPVMKI